MRYIWEDYGIDYASGEPVSLFPIYDSAIEYVSNGEISLSDAYTDYAIWRYFTGDRSIPNSYFNEASDYCTSSTISDFEDTFLLPINKGASQFINLPSEDLNLVISTDDVDDIQLSHLIIGENNSIEIIPLSPTSNNFHLNILDENSNIIIANSNYNSIDIDNVSFSISIQSDIIGDVNGDSLINVQDIVVTVSLALNNQYNTYADINADNSVDILDVVQLVNIILE